jgi:hypothetical protein
MIYILLTGYNLPQLTIIFRGDSTIDFPLYLNLKQDNKFPVKKTITLQQLKNRVILAMLFEPLNHTP